MIKVFLALILSTKFAFACLCISQITGAFIDYSVHIVTNLVQQFVEITLLNTAIETNVSTLESQNELMDDEIELLKRDILQLDELNFYLKQRNELR